MNRVYTNPAPAGVMDEDMVVCPQHERLAHDGILIPANYTGRECDVCYHEEQSDLTHRINAMGGNLAPDFD